MVGLTAVNAMAECFSLTSIRDGKKGTIKWKNGEVDKPLVIKDSGKDEHGTIVVFKPSKLHLGDDAIIVGSELEKWVEKIGYLIPPEMTISLHINGTSEKSIQKKFKNKNGIEDYINKMSKKNIVTPIRLKNSMAIKEVSKGEEIQRDMIIDMVFTYSAEGDYEISDSFCNFVNTVDNGVHYDAVKTAICYYLSKMTKEGMSERESKKIDIQYKDCDPGLVMILNLMTTFNPNFASQTKLKVSNRDIFNPVKQLVLSSLYDYFNKNPKDLQRVCEHVKANAKARIKSTEIRNSVLKGETTNLDEHRIRDFTPANNGKGEYKELFIIEGDSAAGSACNARNPDTQAIFPMWGVPLNTFDISLNDVLKKSSFEDLVRILKCNIGDKFDLRKLDYDKIIIMSDADIDGFRISSLLSVFFLVHLPKIVREGRLYKAITPLYSIKDKNKQFILNKQEYIQIFESNIGKNIRLIHPKTNKQIRDKHLENFLLVNRGYLDELHRVSSHFYVHTKIMEMIVFYRNHKDFLSIMKATFPEIKINRGILTGVYDNTFQNIAIDDILTKRTIDLHNLMFTSNQGDIFYKVEELEGSRYKDKGMQSIGEIMSYCQKFAPIILTRFKGLAELDAEDLWATTMDPNRRQLIRLTIYDIERDMEKFKVIHGPESTERKRLMEFFRLNREDIDN